MWCLAPLRSVVICSGRELIQKLNGEPVQLRGWGIVS